MSESSSPSRRWGGFPSGVAVGVLVPALLIGTAAIAAIPDSTTGQITSCRNVTTGVIRVIDYQGGKRCAGGEVFLRWNAKGVAGTPGARGATGAQGLQGDAGAAGATGATGGTGAQGPKGDTGAQGPIGGSPKVFIGGSENLTFGPPGGIGVQELPIAGYVFPYLTLAQVDLPAGDYSIQADAALSNRAPVAGFSALCFLSSALTNVPADVGGDHYSYWKNSVGGDDVMLQTAVRLSVATTVRLVCYANWNVVAHLPSTIIATPATVEVQHGYEAYFPLPTL